MNSELITAIKMLEEERGMDAEMLFESVELAMVSAYRKVRDYGDAATVVAHMDRETGDVRLYIVKTVINMHDGEISASSEPQGLLASVNISELGRPSWGGEMHWTSEHFQPILI